jgi:hypothetical protein
MKLTIKRAFYHLFHDGNATTQELLTIFLIVGLPVIAFFIVATIHAHIK